MRVIEHRKAMEAEGFRLIQVWVPDVTDEVNRAAIARECDSINQSDKTDDVMDWLDDVTAGVWDSE
jgi:hypothetical protein